MHLSYLDIFLLTLYWIHLGIFHSLSAKFSFVPRSICDRPWRAHALVVASCLGPLLGRVIESRVLITSEQQVAIISSQFIKFSARNCVEIEHNWPKSMRFSCLASCFLFTFAQFLLSFLSQTFDLFVSGATSSIAPLTLSDAGSAIMSRTSFLLLIFFCVWIFFYFGNYVAGICSYLLL